MHKRLRITPKNRTFLEAYGANEKRQIFSQIPVRDNFLLVILGTTSTESCLLTMKVTLEVFLL
jgi:hypothetical protein